MKPGIGLEEAILIVKKIISEVNGIPIIDINPQDSLITDLAMDSIELIDFIIRLEGVGVIINESHLSSSLTVQHIANKF